MNCFPEKCPGLRDSLQETGGRLLWNCHWFMRKSITTSCTCIVCAPADEGLHRCDCVLLSDSHNAFWTNFCGGTPNWVVLQTNIGTCCNWFQGKLCSHGVKCNCNRSSRFSDWTLTQLIVQISHCRERGNYLYLWLSFTYQSELWKTLLDPGPEDVHKNLPGSMLGTNCERKFPPTPSGSIWFLLLIDWKNKIITLARVIKPSQYSNDFISSSFNTWLEHK